MVRGPDGSVSHVTEGRWFSFDDRTVVPWDPSNLEEECFGGSGPRASGAGGTEGGGGVDRAFSAYMLFYDRKDASCCDTQPVVWGENPMQQPAPGPAAGPSSAPGPTPMVMSPRTTVSGAASGLPTLSEQAAAASSPTATPLGMPLALHEEVLRANLSLACKTHVYDRDFLRFLKRALELRMERLSGKHTGKSRRTRLLQHIAPADSASPHSERDGAGSDTHGTPGTEGASGAVTQWPSARRGEESAEFAQHAASLVAGLLVSVISHSPQSMRLQEFSNWVDTVKALCTTNQRMAECLVVELVDRQRWGDDTQHLLMGYRPDLVGPLRDLLRELRACLDSHVNGYARRQLRVHGEPAQAVVDELAPLLRDQDAMVASTMLLDTTIALLREHADLVRQGQAGRGRRGRVPRDAEDAAHTPFIGYAPLFTLLADYYATDSLALAVYQHPLPLDEVVQWVSDIGAACSVQLQESSDPSHPEDLGYLQDMHAAVCLVVQMAARVPSLVQQLPHTAAPYGEPFGEVAAGAAARSHIGTKWPGDEGSPLAVVVEVESVDSWAQLGRSSTQYDAGLVSVLTYSPRILATGSNLDLLIMMSTCCTEGTVAVLKQVSPLLESVSSADGAAEYEEMGIVLQALTRLLAISDHLHNPRITTLLQGNPSYHVQPLLVQASRLHREGWQLKFMTWALLSTLLLGAPAEYQQALACLVLGRRPGRTWVGDLCSWIQRYPVAAAREIVNLCQNVDNAQGMPEYLRHAARSTYATILQVFQAQPQVMQQVQAQAAGAGAAGQDGGADDEGVDDNVASPSGSGGAGSVGSGDGGAD